MYFNQNNLTLQGDGDAILAGSLTQNSDQRLKKAITPLPDVLARLPALHAYHYNWIDSTRSQDLQIGLLAQEIATVFPQLVRADDHSYLSVNYPSMAAVLLEALKGLHAQQKDLDALQQEQHQRIAALQKRMQELKANGLDNVQTPMSSSK
jgi:hypothetical protein